MKALDYTQPMQQITPTVDYTEVIYLAGRQLYVIVWHDNILSEHTDKDTAIAEYTRLITRKPTYDKSI